MSTTTRFEQEEPSQGGRQQVMDRKEVVLCHQKFTFSSYVTPSRYSISHFGKKEHDHWIATQTPWKGAHIIPFLSALK